MRISKKGIDLIKKYEGYRCEAYLCPAQVWTIGYGHTGKDVFKGQTITDTEAERLLKADLTRFEAAVTAIGLTLNQNQFDALVSFTYNCGTGNLKTLIKNRTITQIADGLLLYTKAAGRELSGLVRRRTEERALFCTKDGTDTTELPGATLPKTANRYPQPTSGLRFGSKGDGVRWLQTELNHYGYGLNIDGAFGHKTLAAVKAFQRNNDLVVDGIAGARTKEAFQYIKMQ